MIKFDCENCLWNEKGISYSAEFCERCKKFDDDFHKNKKEGTCNCQECYCDNESEENSDLCKSCKDPDSYHYLQWR